MPVAAIQQEVRSRRSRFPSRVVNGFLLQVTSVSSGSIELGAQISGPGIAAGGQIVNQLDGTPGGPGLYFFTHPEGLFVGDYDRELRGAHCRLRDFRRGRGGEQVTGAGVASLTAIEANLSGSGAGSTWLVNNAQTVAGENMTMTALPLQSSTTSLSSARPQIATISIFAERRLRLRSQPSS